MSILVIKGGSAMKSVVRLILTLMVVFVTISCASGTDKESPPDYTDQEVLEKLISSSRDDYYLVDVRTSDEYASGHIPKAINIPVSTIGDTPPTEDKDALIIVYCRSGGRSGNAKDVLEEMGYTNVHNFGGIIDWSGEVVKE
jgi:rhodanese-related sulfurtransferase